MPRVNKHEEKALCSQCRTQVPVITRDGAFCPKCGAKLEVDPWGTSG